MIQLKNIKPLKHKYEELQAIKILEQDECFMDLPFGAVNLEQYPENPVLYGHVNGIPKIVDALEILSITKRVHLKKYEYDENTDSSSVVECQPNDPDLYGSFRLPIDTPIENLGLLGNDLVLLDRVPKEEPETEDTTAIDEIQNGKNKKQLKESLHE